MNKKLKKKIPVVLPIILEPSKGDKINNVRIIIFEKKFRLKITVAAEISKIPKVGSIKDKNFKLKKLSAP